MKKFLLTMCVALLSVIAFAQYNIIIELIDGTEVKYSAKNVKNIRIDKAEIPDIPADSSAVPADQTGLTFEYNKSTMTATVYGLENREEAKEAKIPSQVLYDGNVYDVTAIGSHAFEACKSLASIEIPNSVTYIGFAAFSHCTSLTSIEIPNSVTEIGIYAFSQCTNLTSIEIPNSVTEIGECAFGSCTSLTSIVVDKDNKVYDSRENCNAIIETASNTLISGCQNTVIPNSVTAIGSDAFGGCTSLTSIEIPNSVTKIGSRAFSHCTSLTSIEIPNSVTKIVWKSFEGCTSLTSIVVDKDNKVYDSRENCNAIIETASNTLIAGYQNTVIPNSVTYIGEGAFANCTSLTSIEIPNSVKEIGRNAFNGCTSLTSIEIHNSVTVIGSNAFYHCTSLTSIEIPNSVTTIGSNAFDGCTSLTSIEIPNSVTEIGYGAFWGCTSLTSIEIPNSVTEIGSYAFDGCTSLTSIVVDKSNKVYDSRENCNAIIETASNTLISGCQNTVIPNSVTAIGSDAFGGCTSLTSIEIPNSVTKIGSYAFDGCTSLTSIVIPNSVTAIGEGAFRYCSSLKTVRVPVSLRGKVGNVFPSTCEIEYY